MDNKKTCNISTIIAANLLECCLESKLNYFLLKYLSKEEATAGANGGATAS